MSAEIDSKLLRNIYPLNKLSPAELETLQPGLRQRFVRKGRRLYELGERPTEYYYVLEGSMQLVNEAETEFTQVAAASGGESIPLPFVVPAMEFAHALTDCEVLCVERDLLDGILHDPTGGLVRAPEHQSVRYRGAAESELVTRHKPVAAPEPVAPTPAPGMSRLIRSLPVNGWERVMLSHPGYLRVPEKNMQKAFQRMTRVNLRERDLLVEQGEPADYFYVIAQGHCEVVHQFAVSGKWQKVNEYGPGGTIGEDALISNKPRNASVRMTHSGAAMRLDGDDFRQLIKPYLARPLTTMEALTQIADGAQWLDVRMPDEVHGRRVINAVSIPHPIIRAKLLRVDRTKRFITVCNAGQDAPVIAFMLCKYGLDAYYLEGGIASLPGHQVRSLPA